jgi:nucleotide-binding universal stress UspA family protein
MSEILVAVDGSEQSDAAIIAAFELARATGDRILFVTAWQELRSSLGVPYGPLLPDAVEIEREWAEKTLEAARTAAVEAGIDAEVIARHGRPAHEIVAVARERGVRLIVVGSHGYGPIEGVILGSVSRGVVAHAPCPVLVVPAPTI